MRWNKADKTLAAAALLFLVTLFWKLCDPQSIVAKGFSFCAEAALIGGVADWFAVTALFKKPLGFPYHTAILPRKRDQFTEGCMKMVREEFFSKKSIFRRIHQLDFLHILLDWIAEPKRKAALAVFILQYVEYMAARLDLSQIAASWEEKIKKAVQGVPQATFYAGLGNWLVANGKDEECFSAGIRVLQKEIAGDRGRRRIETILEDFRRQKTGSGLLSFLASLAEMTNIINYAETAEILQQQILQQLEVLREESNPDRRKLMAALHEAVRNLVRDEEWQRFVAAWRDDMLENIDLRGRIKECLAEMVQQLMPANNDQAAPALRSALCRIIDMEIESGIAVLKQDSTVQQTVDRFLYDLVGRTALQAQLMVGSIVGAALQNMTDEQISQIINDKVGQDLLWIRMNGSIVGGAIGGVIFGVLQFF